jgi:hypothetical protein
MAGVNAIVHVTVEPDQEVMQDIGLRPAADEDEDLEGGPSGEPESPDAWSDDADSGASEDSAEPDGGEPPEEDG